MAIDTRNLKDLNFYEKPIPLIIYFKNLCDIDNPPYQRDECWKTKQSQDLIESIIHKIPMGSLHLINRNEDGRKKYILDGKQRTAAIRGFLENKFKIEVIDDNGEIESVNWRDIEIKSEKKDKNGNYRHPDYRDIQQRVESYSINVITYRPMPMEEQRDLFNKINYSMPLNAEEKVYADSFHAQTFLNGVYNHTEFQHLTLHCEVGVSKNYRHAAIKLLHSTMLLCFGNDLKEEPRINNLKMSTIAKSAEDIHEMYMKSELSEKNEFKYCIEKIGFEKKFNLFSQVIENAADIINIPNHFDKKLSKNDVLDFICYLTFNCISNKLTPQFIRDHYKLFNSIFYNFVIMKREDSAKWCTKTTDKALLERRYRLLETLVEESGIDLSLKNRKIDKLVEFKLRNTSDGICPDCNRLMTEETVTVDHIEPKSRTSNSTNARLICSHCNPQKGNNYIDYSQKKVTKAGVMENLF